MNFNNNFIYWLVVDPLVDPLDWQYVCTLRRLSKGALHRDERHFDVAYLIARGCLDYDKSSDTVEVTAKGRDALAFYEENRSGA